MMPCSRGVSVCGAAEATQRSSVAQANQNVPGHPENLSRWVLGVLYGNAKNRALLRRALWSQVDHCIRKSARRLADVSQVLCRHGLYAEAMIWERQCAHFPADLNVSFTDAGLRITSNLSADVGQGLGVEQWLPTASCPN